MRERLCKFNGVVVMRKSWGIGGGANRSAGRIGWIVVCVRKFEARRLVGGQQGRTTPAGDGKHRVSESVVGVSCSGSGEPGGRTELDLGRSKSLEDHHGAATFGTEPKWVRRLGWRGFWFGLRWLFCVE